MVYKDSRLNLTMEIIKGIKMIKFYTWEDAFQQIISSIRKKETLNLLKINLLYLSVIDTSLNLSTTMVYIYYDKE